MKLKQSIRAMAAALLIVSAAVWSLAQEKSSVKQNAREQTNGQVNAQPSGQTLASPAAVDDASGAVRYAYEFTQPAFLINHIMIEHDAAGRGQITFNRQSGGDPITEPIELSEAAMARITALWNALDFINSNTVYQSDKQFPHLGTMRLRETRGARKRVAEFNWTRDRNAFALVNEYRRAADQAIFVFDIALARQNQPLEAPKLMDSLDALLKRDGLSDPQQLVPLLRDLSTDERIPLIARNHAARLLKKIVK